MHLDCEANFRLRNFSATKATQIGSLMEEYDGTNVYLSKRVLLNIILEYYLICITTQCLGVISGYAAQLLAVPTV